MQTDATSHKIACPESPDDMLAVRQQAGKSPDAPQIVFCGGFHSTMQGNKALALGEYCSRKGFGYTRFDYRGHGESDGDAASLTLHDWLADALCVIGQQAGRVYLAGSSMGAWIATLAALQLPDKIAGLLLLAAAPDFLQELVEPRLSPSDTWDLAQNQAVHLPSSYADSPYPITRALLASGRELSLLDNERMAGLLCPVRLIHGTHDTDVPYTCSERLMARIVHDDASLLLLHKADHRLSDARSLAAIERELNLLTGDLR